MNAAVKTAAKKKSTAKKAVSVKQAGTSTSTASAKHPPVTLRWDLAELPSSQHRAGLAGLVLMVRWLNRNKYKGTCNLTRVDAAGATLEIDLAGMKALFDEVYAASSEEQERDALLKNRQKEVIKPLKTIVRKVEDPKTHKMKEKKVYIYPQVVPCGGPLVDWDRSAQGSNGLWIKLWRDLVWEVLRGVPAQREPYNARAENEETHDAEETWESLLKPDNPTVDLPSTYYLGAQAKTAESIPFRDRARQQFLLHFWPFAVQVYVPQVVDREGKRKFTGYAVAIPDVADLKTFCGELPKVLDGRGIEKNGYRPRDAVVDLAVEGALDLLKRLHEQVAKKEAARETSDLVLGVDVIHVEKEGNNVRVRGSTRLEPMQQMLDEYAQLKGAFWNPDFCRQRLINLVNQREWWSGFDTLMCTLPSERTISNNYFQHDAREAFKTSEVAMQKAKEEGGTPSLEALVYHVVGGYVFRKLKMKYGLDWEHAKANDHLKKEYEEKKEKVAKEAFLAARSRTGADFVDFFTSTLCSVPQHLPEGEYLALSLALTAETEKVRTLTLLALSARG